MRIRQTISGQKQVTHDNATESHWTFLTNHGHVLLVIAKNPNLRLRDIANLVGVTERTAGGIVSDLEEAGYIRRSKVGRRNHYILDPDQPLRHPLESHHHIGALLEAIEHGGPARK